MAPSPPVSVVIPTLGRRAALDRCLASAPDPADVARRLGLADDEVLAWWRFYTCR